MSSWPWWGSFAHGFSSWASLARWIGSFESHLTVTRSLFCTQKRIYYFLKAKPNKLPFLCCFLSARYFKNMVPLPLGWVTVLLTLCRCRNWGLGRGVIDPRLCCWTGAELALGDLCDYFPSHHSWQQSVPCPYSWMQTSKQAYRWLCYIMESKG